jgi:hypothetical protein
LEHSQFIACYNFVVDFSFVSCQYICVYLTFVADFGFVSCSYVVLYLYLLLNKSVYWPVGDFQIICGTYILSWKVISIQK